MPGEATHRTLRAFKDEGVSHAVAIIRDSLDEEEQRAKRKEYQQYLSQLEQLNTLSQFSYEQFDYTPYLERVEFVPPPTPDYSYLPPEAEKRTREQHKPHGKAVGGVLALAIFVDLFVLNTPAGLLSILSVFVAVFLIHRQLEDQRRAIAAAIAAAEAEVVRLLAEFQENVDQRRGEFDYAETERVSALRKLLSGSPDAILEACQQTAATVNLPFVLRGGVEFSGPDALISFTMPDGEFVPKTERREDQPGKYSVTDRTLTNTNHMYAEVIAAAMLQLILRIFEQVPAFETIAVNGFRQAEGRQICLIGVMISREDLPAVTAGDGGLKIVEERGAVRIQTSNALAPVEPMMPQSLANAVEREVHKGSINCSFKVV